MSDYNKPFVDLSGLLPQVLRNRTNESLLKNIFNKQLTKEESLPLLGFIGDKLISDNRPALPQPNLERELNTLQPMVYAKVGSEEYVFTFNDVIQKLKLLGVDVDEMDSWAKAKSFNFVPPIDLDKFINYPRYYWYGKLVTELAVNDIVPSNPTMEAEYYVIGLPGDKLLQLTEVEAVIDDATVLAGVPANIDGVTTLAVNDRVLVVNQGTSNGIYTIANGAWSRAADLSSSSQFKTGLFVFCRFGSTHENTHWTLSVPSLFTLGTSANSWNRGNRKISDWTINNFWAHEDDLRVLGINPANCIQALAPIIEYDFDLELNDTVINGIPARPTGAVTSIRMMDAGAGYSSATPPTVVIAAPPTYPSIGKFPAEISTTVNGDGTLTINLLNGGVGYVDAPVITITGGGAVSRDATAYALIGDDNLADNIIIATQRKHQFNQVPLFNLYNLDGSHSHKVSPVFYYAEDASNAIDSIIKRRISRDVYGDFTFEQGLLNNDIQHFFKHANELQGIWQPGPDVAPRWVKRGIDGTPVDYPAGPKYKELLYAKMDVQVASTQHITSLNGLPVVDGYQVAVGDRVLVKDQLTGAQEDNGIYIAGRGYIQTPNVIITSSLTPTAPANIICTVNQGRISSFRVIDVGAGYSTVPGETSISLQHTSGIGNGTDGVQAIGIPVLNSSGGIIDVTLVDGGHWSRASDTDGANVIHGIHTHVLNGDSQADTYWALDSINPIVVGRTPLVFRQYDNGDGAWSIPQQMFHNMKHENRKTIGYGDLYEHFFSIIGAQPELEGSPFGFNNWRHLTTIDLGLGGSIKDFNTSFDLFLGLMNQRDISVPSILNFAQLQYGQALNTINEFFTQNVSDFLTSGLLGSLSAPNPYSVVIDGLFSRYKTQTAARADLGSIYVDTTNPLSNWPATLPYLGLIFDPANPTMALKVKPGIEFDKELGLDVIVHHDGHRSPAIAKNAAYEQALTKTQIMRSTGQMVAGIFSTNTPVTATALELFRNQLWYNPSTNDIFFFDVTSDTTPIYPVNHGQLYFNRSTNTMYKWNQSLNGNQGDWEATAISDAWKPFYFHNLLNSLILRVELELYNNVQPLQPSVWDTTAALTSPLLEGELAIYAANNGYDMYAPDYTPTNAFTWNYSSAGGLISGIPVPAPRWFDLYKQYFVNTATGLRTCRPNLEPWILTGEDEGTFRQTWDGNAFNTPAMWSHVKSIWTKKLAVNIVGTPSTNASYGALLPPYVNPTLTEATEALLNVIPDNISNGYVFGDNGPVELAWRKSLEFNYSLLRAGFKMDPINFISQTWGLNKATVHEYELDRSAGRRESWLEFKLHGDTITNPTARDLAVLFEPLLTQQLWADSKLITDTVTELKFAGTDGDYPLATPLNPVQWLLKDLTLTPTGGIWRVMFNDGSSLSERPPVAIGKEYIDRWISFTLRDEGLDFELHDKIIITYDGTHYNFEFIPSTYKLFNGINQTYVNLLRYNGADPSISFNVVMLRDWELKLGYRVSGMLNTDNLKLSSDSFTLHRSSFTALIKKNPSVTESWLDALRIQLVKVGTTQWSDSGYNIPKQGMKADDWAFRVETYNPRHPEIKYYNLDTTGPFNTFNALMTSAALSARTAAEIVLSDAEKYYQTMLATPTSSADEKAAALDAVNSAADALRAVNSQNEEWRIYQNVQVDLANVDLTKRTDVNGLITRAVPFVITGLQNLLNFLFGYVKRLETDGWRFNAGDQQTTDAETGRAISWQLEIEKLIYATYHGAQAGTGNVLNPFLGSVWFNTPRGMVSSFDRPLFSDVSTSQLVFDVLGGTISKSNLRVFRQDENTEIVSSIPMMSAHLMTDEYEHVILFTDYNDMSQQKDLIFDPFLGVRINRIYFDGQRQLYFNGRPSYGGHYLYGQEVRKNIEASVDGILNYYDANEISADTPTARAARELLGYQKKDYMAQINTSDRSQFHFWRGLIHNKGSNNSMTAFLNNAKFKSAQMDEYWAVKVAEYGDARQLNYPELKINAVDCEHSFTRIQFMEDADVAESTFVTIASSDEDRWFSLEDVGTHLYFDAENLGDVTVSGTIGQYFNLPWNTDKIESSVPVTYVNNNTIQLLAAGTVTVTGYGPAKPKFSPIKLIDYVNNSIVKEIPIWDPARGAHQTNAMEVIDVMGTVDPAKYNYSVQTVGNTNYDPMRSWGADQIGKTWFDTTNLGYVPYYDEHIFPSTDERLSRWGVPADWASIDIFEWVGAKIPPSQWDDTAKTEEGNAEIPIDQRASGRVARKTLYNRARTWQERPIAWSYSSNPPTIYHQLASSGLAGIRLSATSGDALVTLQFGRFSNYGITAAMHLSAVDLINEKPIGEGTLDGNINYQIGSLNDWSAVGLAAYANFTNLSVTPSQTNFGTVLGPIMFSGTMPAGIPSIRATSLDNNQYQEIAIADTPDLIGAVINFDFDQLGITISANVDFDHSSIALQADRITAILDTFGNINHDVFVRETMGISIFLPFNTADMNNDTGAFGWKAYNVPTSDDLATELPSPNNRWQPYYGDYVNLPYTAIVRDRLAAYNSSPLLFSDGSPVSKVSGVWSNWTPQNDERQIHKYYIPTDLQFTFTNTPTSVTIYVDGLIQRTRLYSITGNTVTIAPGTDEIGDEITVISRRYTPSSSELSFDPTVADDPTVNVQYKFDHQYVTEQIRDSSGNVATTYYYFWVTNKSTPTKGNKMSIKTAASLLKSNTYPYMVLLGAKASEEVTPAVYLPAPHSSVMDAPAVTLHVRYTKIAIKGLNQIVTRDNFYKLRFTRDFTLRDNPDNIKLKNVHQEWSLIRQNQLAKVPSTLWDRLVDAACGQNAGGEQLPIQSRIDYDARHGTATRYGTGADQILVDTALAKASILNTVLNTTITYELSGTKYPDYIKALDFGTLSGEAQVTDRMDAWFGNAAKTRQTLAIIWNNAKPQQINEIFFAVLSDALSSNLQMTDIFKTSYLSLYSVRLLSTVDVLKKLNGATV